MSAIYCFTVDSNPPFLIALSAVYWVSARVFLLAIISFIFFCFAFYVVCVCECVVAEFAFLDIFHFISFFLLMVISWYPTEWKNIKGFKKYEKIVVRENKIETRRNSSLTRTLPVFSCWLLLCLPSKQFHLVLCLLYIWLISIHFYFRAIIKKNTTTTKKQDTKRQYILIHKNTTAPVYVP